MSDTPKTYFAVLNAHSFLDCTADGSPIMIEEGSPTHFFPAFESKEEAIKFAGGKIPIMAISSVEPKEGGPTFHYK